METLLTRFKRPFRTTWQATIRNLKSDWRYKFKLLLNSLYTVVNLVLFSVLADVVQPKAGALPLAYGSDPTLAFMKFLFVGTWFWAVFTHPIEDVIGCVQEESQKGTIGLLLSNNVSVPILLVGRFIASFIISIILATIVVVPLLAALGMFTIGFFINLPWLLLAFACTTAFVLALSVWVSSYALLFKKTGVLSDIFTYGLKVATGMYFPIFGLGKAALILEAVPVASGVDFMRDIFIVGQPVAHGTPGMGFGWQATVPQWIAFVWQTQVVGIIVVVVIAILSLRYCVKKAKMIGSVETY